MVQSLFRRTLQPLHQFMTTPEKLRVAPTGNEVEWLIWVLVDRWIKFADNFIQDCRSNDERSSAVTAAGWVADAIDRVLRKKHDLVYIGGHAPLPKMFCKSSVSHQDNTVVRRLLLSRRAAFVGVAAIVRHD
jgi:hypothetical protein